MFATYITDKGLISPIFFKTLKLRNKGAKTNRKKWMEKDMDRQFTKRYKNCLKICKDVQSHL